MPEEECPVCDDGTELEMVAFDIGGGPATYDTMACPKCLYDPREEKG